MEPDRSAAMEAFRQRAMRRSPIPVPGVSQGAPASQPPSKDTQGAPSQMGATGGPVKSHNEEMESLIVKTLIQRLKQLGEPVGGKTATGATPNIMQR